LLVTTKCINPIKLYTNEYYEHYYLNKKLCDGIVLVAQIERSNKKNAAEFLVEGGLSKYIGSKVKEQIENDRIARKLIKELRYPDLRVRKKYFLSQFLPS